MDTKRVGKSISFLRSNYGLTQKDLAMHLGVTDKAVSRWERGVGAPDISLLSKLSIVLDTDIESILEGNLSQHEQSWSGILKLDYDEGINAGTLIYNKCAVCYQLSLLMLAGIKEIHVCGKSKDIDIAYDIIGNGERYGINVDYERMDKLGESKSAVGTMLVDGLDFIYGKDVTKCFRRIMNNSRYPINLVNYNKISTSVYFYPNTYETKLILSNEAAEIKVQTMERGIITFPIKSNVDVLDASNLVRILEEHQGEAIADLEEIAVRRNMKPSK